MQDLVERVRNGDEKAIVELQAQFPRVIRDAFYKVFTGALRSSLSINAEHLLEDIEAMSWADFFRRVTKSKALDTTNLGGLLNTIATRRSLDAFDSSIKKREQKPWESEEEVQKKKTAGKHVNNIFSKSEDDIILLEDTASRTDYSPEQRALKAEAIENMRNNLTDRESNVMDLLMQGKSQREISEQLGVTVRTISSDIASIRRAAEQI